MSKQKRGFANMDRGLNAQISSLGGQASHRAGTAHEFDHAEGQEAGSRGGRAKRHFCTQVNRHAGKIRLRRVGKTNGYICPVCGTIYALDVENDRRP